jgi:hypothetical protein
VLDYYLKAAASSPLTLEILDAKGDAVRRFASDEKPRPTDLQRIQITPDWVPVPEPPSAEAGAHRFVWDLHSAPPKELVSPTGSFRGSSGPWAPPGRYTVRLTIGGKTMTQPLLVARDPRLASSLTDTDLVRQFELARDIQAERVRVAAGLRQADALRKQIASLRGKGAGAAAGELDAFVTALDRAAGPPVPAAGEEFFEAEEASPTSLRRVSISLSGLQGAVESADSAPTPDALSGLAERRKLVATSLAAWQDLLARELPALNRALQAANLPPLQAE